MKLSKSVGRLPAFCSVGVLCAVALATQPEGGRGGQPGGQPRQGAPGQPGEGGPRGAGRAPSVEGSMKTMGRSLRTLKDQLGDASKKEENLRLINDMQRGCIMAKGGTPAMFGELKTDAEKTAAMDKYRRKMIELAKLLLDAESAMLDGKTDAAKTALDSAVKMRDEQHKAFGVTEDEAPAREGAK
jgi:hypothetical protein